MPTAAVPVAMLASRLTRCCAILCLSLPVLPTYATYGGRFPLIPYRAYTAGQLGKSETPKSALDDNFIRKTSQHSYVRSIGNTPISTPNSFGIRLTTISLFFPSWNTVHGGFFPSRGLPFTRLPLFQTEITHRSFSDKKRLL